MSDFSIELDLDMDSLQSIFGQHDSYIAKIEKQLHVTVVNRDGSAKIIGEERNAQRAAELIEELARSIHRGTDLEEQRVDYVLQLAQEEENVSLQDMDSMCICHTVAGKPVKPKTIGQQQYVQAMKDHMIVFGLGPAGTGKTYLAMAMAITAFKNNEVERIILTRPAIEAGEKLGFLPGDLQSKVDPYLRPLYDALYQIMGAESFQKNMEKGAIEVAPLAYMRGRTLDDSFIILDEAQNTTPEQMKMFLTRLGFNSKMVITGDITQIDLPDGKKSGLKKVMHILRNVNDIAICKFDKKDVVRHKLVQDIVNAYQKYEEDKNNGRS